MKEHVKLLREWLETDGQKTYEELADTMYLNPLYLFAEWLDEPLCVGCDYRRPVPGRSTCSVCVDWSGAG